MARRGEFPDHFPELPERICDGPWLPNAPNVPVRPIEPPIRFRRTKRVATFVVLWVLLTLINPIIGLLILIGLPFSGDLKGLLGDGR